MWQSEISLFRSPRGSNEIPIASIILLHLLQNGNENNPRTDFRLNLQSRMRPSITLKQFVGDASPAVIMSFEQSCVWNRLLKWQPLSSELITSGELTFQF
ncbi:hypothetical protein TNCV_426111 [Trichonephila clavipes]|nr:hypothetical protein TNCV_426111 [Trichonephila clavipes]